MTASSAVLDSDTPLECVKIRETEEAITLAKREGPLAVEMETAALYAFAPARQRAVLCLAHVTNCMAKML
jgi:purine-nucleoside phosphorylase